MAKRQGFFPHHYEADDRVEMSARNGQEQINQDGQDQDGGKSIAQQSDAAVSAEIVGHDS